MSRKSASEFSSVFNTRKTQYEESNTVIRKLLKQINAGLDDINQKRTTKVNDANNSARKLTETNRQIEQTKEQLKQRGQHIKQLEDKLNALNKGGDSATVRGLNEQLKNLGEKMRNCEKEKRELTEKISTLSSNISKYDSQLRQKDEKVKEVEAKLKQAIDQGDRKQIQTNNNKADKASIRAAECEEKLTKISRAYSTTTDRVRILQQQLKELSDSKNSLIKEIEILKKNATNPENKTNIAAAIAAATAAEKARSIEEIKNLQGRINELEKMASGQNSQLQVKLQECDRLTQEYDRLYGMFSDMLNWMNKVKRDQSQTIGQLSTILQRVKGMSQ